MNVQLQPAQVNGAGHLTIGGVDTLKLAEQYGTPLMVYDVNQIVNQVENFKRVFEERGVDYVVSYASKAFAIKAIYQLLKPLGAHVHADVVSAGEMYTALSAGFPAERLTFHGNNKSYQELSMAVEHHLGTIVIDNFHEIELLDEVLNEQNATTDVMLRITPGIAAHTHQYTATGQVDSKFGFDLDSGQADKALQEVLTNPRMKMRGVHVHIGSQIFELNGFQLAARKLMGVIAHWANDYGYQAEIINVGGGFGIRYVSADHPLKPEEFVAAIIDTVKEEAQQLGLKLPAIWIEPGRSIVGPAGYTLYTVGSRKDIPNLRSYVSVDGGMGDNIRPALYQAEYETVLANDPQAPVAEHVRLAGKYCESGDILAQYAALPKTKPGDVLAMLDTGAYGYTMASNYNRNPRPAVVFVKDGQSQLVVKRETVEDLARLDQSYRLG
ncbi:MAG TPA: diaminopimelate decarboxylase [Candidatus Limosilactobacillus merdipullorum]|uniref:Diaminopimelate decarboxylase n=1 Tax=Candidatus Limosilactobacillus merdipullorum TaxID=2838653 RepID=A0A9D1QPP2_9LACO|nr:diaminopimelate decarboxylase [Candidatus Limosilactobacillus merdipullorum]